MSSPEHSTILEPEKVPWEHPNYPILYNLTPEVHARIPELVKLPLVRPIKLRPDKSLELLQHSHKSENRKAAMLYQRGKLQATPCVQCTPPRYNGPFQSCVALDNCFSGSCANCAYAGNASMCSIRPKPGPKFTSSAKRSRSPETRPFVQRKAARKAADDLSKYDTSDQEDNWEPKTNEKKTSNVRETSSKSSKLSPFPSNNVEAAKAWLRAPQNLVVDLYKDLKINEEKEWAEFEDLLASITGADTPQELRTEVIYRVLDVSRLRKETWETHSINEVKGTPVWPAVLSKILSFMETDKMSRLWKDAAKEWITIHVPKYLERCIYLSWKRWKYTDRADAPSGPPTSSKPPTPQRGTRKSMPLAPQRKAPSPQQPVTRPPAQNGYWSVEPTNASKRSSAMGPQRTRSLTRPASQNGSHQNFKHVDIPPRKAPEVSAPPKPTKPRSARYTRIHDEATSMSREERQLELADYKFRVSVLKTAISNGPPTSRTSRYEKILEEVKCMGPEEQKLELADLEFRSSVFRDAMG